LLFVMDQTPRPISNCICFCRHPVKSSCPITEGRWLSAACVTPTSGARAWPAWRTFTSRSGSRSGRRLRAGQKTQSQFGSQSYDFRIYNCNASVVPR
jgi:hypothetical protein